MPANFKAEPIQSGALQLWAVHSTVIPNLNRLSEVRKGLKKSKRLLFQGLRRKHSSPSLSPWH